MSLSLTTETLGKYTYNKYFLETGTFTGGGVEIARLCGFEQIISIEADERLYRGVLKNYDETDNIHLHLGDSEKILSEIIEKIEEPITFFLDSHIVDMNKEIAHDISTREIPLIQELEIIKNHPIKTHTILIDDRRMMGFSASRSTFGWITEEWEAITEDIVMGLLFEINSDYEIAYENTVNGPNDIIVAKPK
jgi:hypothetical protein